jgi:hypothetical protein
MDTLLQLRDAGAKYWEEEPKEVKEKFEREL